MAASFHIVGVGASAGGLEALEALFALMPEDSGLAFVVLQHLSPDFESRMDELLGRRTRIPIRKVTDAMEVEPDHIYLIPPKKDMILSGGKLLLTDKDPARGLTLPIDHFLRSLAQDAGRFAMAVILSGTGSDGSRGLREVHEAGGLVIAQDPRTASFDGMPRSAIDTGLVDVELPPSAIPEALVRYARAALDGSGRLVHLPPVPDSPIGQILELLRAQYGIDFAHYKPNTVLRRVERRLTMSRVTDVETYARLVSDEPAELNALYFDLLIGVTRFFRDPDAFDFLAASTIPPIVAGTDDIRIWVPGCATGEEVYSYAILLHEEIGRTGSKARVKIFATDVHPQSLDLASSGVYEREALRHVSDARRERYFSPAATDRFRIAKELREMVVFARHNVINDAPFTRMDLVSCRNLLIYLQPPAQKKAISLFHFGLKTSGVLVLGPSESPGELSEEFETIEGRWKIYRKRRDIRLPTEMRLLVPAQGGALRARAPSLPGGRRLADGILLAAYDQLLTRHVPPAYLVDEHYDLLHSFGGSESILMMRGGRASTNLLDLVPEELRAPLAGALQQAAKQQNAVRYTGVDVSVRGKTERFRVTVQTLPEPKLDTSNFLVELERLEHEPRPPSIDEVDLGGASREYVANLEAELRFTRENLQATIEELETSNEELQATNEEMVAANEELQSTNEELHSVNEELHTVNVEHQRKIEQLTELTDDMDNLLESTDIGVLFLGQDLSVRKFTPPIARIFHLMPQDIGRRFDTFAHDIDYPSLLSDVQEVLRARQLVEREVQTAQGEMLLVRLLPYRSRGETSGVVLTVVDIATLKRAEAEARRLSAIVKSAREAIIATDLSGRVVAWNQGAEELFGYREQDALGMDARLLMPEERREEEADRLMRATQGQDVPNYETQRVGRGGLRVDVEVSLSPVIDVLGKVIGASSIARDVTARKQAADQAQRTIAQREQFLALLSHELRNPLMALANAVRVLSRDGLSSTAQTSARDVVRRQVQQMARLLEDLLDSSRMRRDRIELNREVLDLRATVDGVLDAARAQADDAGVRLAIEVPEQPIEVEADITRLQQLQVNLLTNAIRYSSPGGTVRYALRRNGTDAIVVVEDDGDGIPLDILPNIFEPFFAGHRRAGEKGMGLGLSLARAVAQAHGGDITAASDGPGTGARFEARFPLADVREPVVASPPRPSAETNPRLVLLVDDDVDSRELLGVLLEHAGHDVIQAGTGREGLDLLLAHRPRAAIVDIGLPDMSGLEVARRARNEIGSNGTRLIALTGFGQQKDREAAADAGFDHHLVKPLDFDTIESVLQADD